MDRDLVAGLGFGLMLVLMLARVPIGWSMGIVGVLGFGVLSGVAPAFNLLANVPLSVLGDYDLAVIPMFILMGALASYGGISADLFAAGRAWIGHRRGGLGYAAIAMGAGFAAINGSAVATTASMTQVALPEMRKNGYAAHFSAGLIAAGGTLGIMIPPSVIFVLYSLMTDTDLPKLFAAGIVPGVLAAVMYAAVVQIYAVARPDAVPAGPRYPWGKRLRSLQGLWPVIALFVFVIGGIYGGWFTVQEAAAAGVMGSLAIGVARGHLRWPQVKAALLDSLRISSSIFMIVVGAQLFGYFLTVTQFTQGAVQALVQLPFGAYGALTVVMLGYLVLGALMDELAMILLTVPIVFPAMMQLGFDPVWFGVIIVMAVTFGMVCPPVGINVFVINSIARDIPLGDIYRGTFPFIAADLVRLLLLCIFPSLALWLPGLIA